MSPSDLRASFFHKPWVRVKNASGEVIPPFSVLRITNATYVNGEIIYTVDKPNATFQRFYLANGPFAIGAGATNEGYASTLMQGGFVQFDNTATGGIVIGKLGGKASSWLAQGSGYNFPIIGPLKIVTIGSNTYTVMPVIQNFVEEVTGKALSAGVQSGDSATITVMFSGVSTTLGQTIPSVFNYGRYVFGGAGGSPANEYLKVSWQGEYPTMSPRNGSNAVRVVPDSSIASDADGTVSLFIGADDSGDNITARNGTAASIDNTKLHVATCYETGSYVIL